jgi:predicted RNA-binding Zn-ribbon protein involved in translation (DUF1610 family)
VSEHIRYVFRVTTDCHGDQHVPAEVISVMDFAAVLTYSFPCPQCGVLVEKTCQQPRARILVEAGANWTCEGSVQLFETDAQRWTREATERIAAAIARINHPSHRSEQ